MSKILSSSRELSRFVTLLSLMVAPLSLQADAPVWWTQRGVLTPGAPADDYAAVNQGQVKHIAKQAYKEFKLKLPNGPGGTLDAIWAYPTVGTDDYVTINIGQLKNVAKPFYDRLIAEGVASDYPWGGSTPADDYALANIGQLKNVFSFSVFDPNDTDADGFLDSWEIATFGDLTTTTENWDADYNGDGITDREAWLLGLNPTAPLPDRAPPAWPSGPALTVTNESSTGFTLSWPQAADSAGGAIKYVIYRNGESQSTPITALTNQISFTGLSGLQRWHVRPVDASNNYGPSSSVVERVVGQIVDVGLNVSAKNRSVNLSKWGFSPLKTETSLAPIIRSFAKKTVTQTKNFTSGFLLLSDPDEPREYLENNYGDGTQTAITTKYSHTQEVTTYSGSYSKTFSYGLYIESSSGTWTENGTLIGSGEEDGRTYTINEPIGGYEYFPFTPPQPELIIISTATELKKQYTSDEYTFNSEDYTFVEQHTVLSDPIADESLESATIARLPAFESISSWTSSATALRDWSASHLSLSLGDAQYKVSVSSTESGKFYRVSWLEVFYPEPIPHQPPPEPISLNFRQVVLEGTGQQVESEVYTLFIPEEEGTVGLVAAAVNLAAPAALAVNDNFDERVAGDGTSPPEPWVMDMDTPSPVRSDGKAALAGLGSIWPSSRIQLTGPRFDAGTTSVKLAITSGAARARMIAIAPDGSGEDDAYTESDWEIIPNGTELWGNYYGRKDGSGNALPDWAIYLEGLEPGKVDINLTVNRYGESLVAGTTTYITRTDFIGRDPESGETYPMGGLADGGRPRPEVVIQELDAELNEAQDMLTLTLSGEVRDGLSETLDDATRRLPFLTFQINGKAIAGIPNLPSRTNGEPRVRPWQSTTFTVPFERVLTVPIKGPRGLVVRALTGPNPLGERGWDEAWVQVGRSPTPAQAASARLLWVASPGPGQADQIRIRLGSSPPDATDPLLVEDAAHSGRFVGQVRVAGVNRPAVIELAPAAIASGAPNSFGAMLVYQTSEGSETLSALWENTGGLIYGTGDALSHPGVRHPLRIEQIAHGEGSGAASLESIVARVDGLQEAPEGTAISTVIDSREELGEALTFSPEYFYPTMPARPGQPMRFIVGLDEGGPLQANEAISAIRAGGNNFKLRVGNHIAEGATLYGVDTSKPVPAPALPPDLESIQQVRAIYKRMYCQPVSGDGGVIIGQKLLDYYDKFLWGFQIDEDEDEVELRKNSDGSYTILVGSELDPISAAQGVFESLVKLSVLPRVQSEAFLDGYGGELFAGARLSAVRSQGAQVGGVALEIYKAFIAILNEGADWVITVDELSQGNYAAAIGFLPFVPATGKYILKHRTTGAILMEIQGEGFTRLAQSLRSLKLDADKVLSRRATVHALKDLRDMGAIDQKVINILVDSKHMKLGKGSSRANLRQILGDPPGDANDYRAHHWLPLEHEDRFLKCCIDPNDVGIWLRNQVHKNVHEIPVTEFVFSGKNFNSSTYNDLWEQFFDQFPNATETQIDAFLDHLRKKIYGL